MLSIINKMREAIARDKNLDAQQIKMYNRIVNLYKQMKYSTNWYTEKDFFKELDNLSDIINSHVFKKSIIKNSKKGKLYDETDFGLHFHNESIDDFVKKINQDFERAKHRNEYLFNKLTNFNEELQAISKHDIVITNDNNIQKQKLQDLDELKSAKIGKKFNKEKLFKYVVIDIETTGLNSNRNKIIELSAIKYVDFEPIECYTTLINPNIEIPENITSINKINNKMVENAPTINQVLSDFDNFISGYSIVGYNVFFDIKFLYCNGSKIFNKSTKIYDVYELAKKAFKSEIDDYKLESLCKELCDLYLDNSHRSLADCLATNKIFLKCISEITDI